MNKKFNKYLLFPQNFSEKASFRPQKQCCGSKYIEFGSGSRISAQFGSGSRNLLNTDPDSDPQHWLNLKWGVVKIRLKNGSGTEKFLCYRRYVEYRHLSYFIPNIYF